MNGKYDAAEDVAIVGRVRAGQLVGHACPGTWARYREEYCADSLADLATGDVISCSDFKECAPEVADLFQPAYMSGSDYSGGSVERANFATFCAAYVNGDEAEDVPGLILYSGGYGTYGLVIRLDLAEPLPRDLVSLLAGLADYPLLNEEAHSEWCRKAQREAWDSYLADDFRQLAEKVHGIECYGVSDDQLWDFFWQFQSDSDYLEWGENLGGDQYVREQDLRALVGDIDPADLLALGGTYVDPGDAAQLALFNGKTREAHFHGFSGQLALPCFAA